MQAAKQRIPIWLIVLYVLALAPLAAWPFVAYMSVFAFDAPGSAQDPAVWRGVGLVLAYPLLPLLGIPLSFIAYRHNQSKLAYFLLGIAALPLLLMIVGLAALVVVNLLITLGVKL